MKECHKGCVIVLIGIAYFFSFAMRLIWVYWASKHPEYFYHGQLMINTNDGYMWASSAQHALSGAHAVNPRIASMWGSATVFLTVAATKLTPWSLETVILYMPSVIASLIVIPVIFLGKLYRNVWWGFFAALLASVTWSFYNRTMTGYYDTDMFAVTSATFILYFLIASVEKFTLKSAYFAALMIASYPFLYDQGKAIVMAMGLIYFAFLLFYHRKEPLAYRSILLVSLALLPVESLTAPFFASVAKITVITVVYVAMHKAALPIERLRIVALVAAAAAIVLGDAFGVIVQKVLFFLDRSTSEGSLHYLLVNQTVREAGHIPFETFANRISGSIIGFVLAMVGYGWLVWKHRAFLLALPLLGIGLFAWWGGLRFTVYAVPVAAIAVIFLIDRFMPYITDKPMMRYFGVGVGAALLLVPNIRHIIDYKVPTVMEKREVAALDALNRQADTKDYTIAWWDYGYPIWFYSDTNTLIDGGKHQNDNYIVSKILQSDSPRFAANFARLAVETYVDANYSTVTSVLFKHGDKGRYDVDELLVQLDSASFTPPKKTRDIYLYMPIKMLFIYPTVARFGNIDLKTGKPLRPMLFEFLAVAGQKGNTVLLQAGRTQMMFDMKTGLLRMPNGSAQIDRLVIVDVLQDGSRKVRIMPYAHDSGKVLVFIRAIGSFVVMDAQTYASLYVQMGILGNYDGRYFEKVVQSPLTTIYRVKR